MQTDIPSHICNGVRVPLVDPASHEPLEQRADALVNCRTGDRVATIVDGVPRFVDAAENYAESFGWQWKKWEDIRSVSRNPSMAHRELVLDRTHFDQYEMPGKSILECGMGGGDDTEVLLQLPFGEVHSFDLSTAIERGAKFLNDERLTISQASIFAIPYPDEAFDFVFCHRVLQHTPDPPRALRCICRKVKPGGVLFAHAYKKSWRYMMEWRYKYRWLTKRMSRQRIYRYVEGCGPALHRINKVLYRNRITRFFAYNFVPFYWRNRSGPTRDFSEEQLLELEKLITFDALTPAHDHPMSSRCFRGIIEDEGFQIQHIFDPKTSPIYCTALKR